MSGLNPGPRTCLALSLSCTPHFCITMSQNRQDLCTWKRALKCVHCENRAMLATAFPSLLAALVLPEWSSGSGTRAASTPPPGHPHYLCILHRDAPSWCTQGDRDVVLESFFGDRSELNKRHRDSVDLGWCRVSRSWLTTLKAMFSRFLVPPAQASLERVRFFSLWSSPPGTWTSSPTSSPSTTQ